jgi:hypothetical protein
MGLARRDDVLDMGCYEVSWVIRRGRVTQEVWGRCSAWLWVRIQWKSWLDTYVAPIIYHTTLLSTKDIARMSCFNSIGTGVANSMAALSAGIRAIDSSIGGLGGCPYLPGATGNVATEDVLYALRDSRYSAPGHLDSDALVDVGFWISDRLGRDNSSRELRQIVRVENEKVNHDLCVQDVNED